MATALTGNRPSLKVNVVTPRGPVAQGEVGGVTAPGRLGELEVLPGHVPFLTELHHGVLTVGERGKKAQVLAVGPGFLSIDASGEVQVLVEQAVLAENADIEGARKVVAEVGPVIKGWKQDLDAEYRNVKAKLDWAQAQLDAVARIR
jgi:F-type H+-transporting ATPase subunit epsilon